MNCKIETHHVIRIVFARKYLMEYAFISGEQTGPGVPAIGAMYSWEHNDTMFFLFNISF